jgi:hypothetical protein
LDEERVRAGKEVEEEEGPAKRESKATDPLELASLPPEVTGAAGREGVALQDMANTR